MSRLVIFLLIVIIGLSSGYLYKQRQIKDGWKKLRVGETTVKVQVRDTMEGRSRGLSGREKLEEDEGMLFIFPVVGKYGFWMKEMKFDLDVLWIKDDVVVGLVEGVVAPKNEESPARFKPESAINKVLEVNSGFVKRHGIKVGDQVILDN